MKLRYAMLAILALVSVGCQSNPPSQKTLDATNYCFQRFGGPSNTNYDSCVYARQMGMEVVEGLFHVDEIRNVQEMFLTSTTREIVPIRNVDGSPVGSGKPGPVTLKLLHAYRDAIERLTAED